MQNYFISNILFAGVIVDIKGIILTLCRTMFHNTLPAECYIGANIRLFTGAITYRHILSTIKNVIAKSKPCDYEQIFYFGVFQVHQTARIIPYDAKSAMIIFRRAI